LLGGGNEWAGKGNKGAAEGIAEEGKGADIEAMLFSPATPPPPLDDGDGEGAGVGKEL
jgi:hypothetical protein